MLPGVAFPAYGHGHGIENKYISRKLTLHGGSTETMLLTVVTCLLSPPCPNNTDLHRALLQYPPDYLRIPRAQAWETLTATAALAEARALHPADPIAWVPSLDTDVEATFRRAWEEGVAVGKKGGGVVFLPGSDPINHLRAYHLSQNLSWILDDFARVAARRIR